MRNVPVWADAVAEPQPTAAGRIETTVCVVGLGVAGLVALERLTEFGIDAIGLDQGRIAGGASSRNGGFLLAGAPTFHHETVRLHGRDRAAAIHELTLAEIRRWAGQLPQSVRLSGSLRIAVSKAELDDCADHAEALRDDGFPVEAYTGPEGQGILLPDDAAFDPAARCCLLAEHLLEHGVRLYEQSAVTGIEARAVRTAAAEVSCDAVIVAVDGGLEHVVPELEGRVRSARAQMLATAPGSGRINRPVYARWGMDYWQMLTDGRLVLGGGRDRGGDAEWTLSPDPTDEVQRYLNQLLEQIAGPGVVVSHRWGATIGFTDDRLPVVGKTTGGIYCCGAYSGTGNLLAPIAGRAIADLVCGESSESATIIGRPPP